MRVRWMEPAAHDLIALCDYTREQHGSAQARDTALRISEAIDSLRQFPHLGRIGRRAGTRELVLTGLPFLAIYRVREDAIVGVSMGGFGAIKLGLSHPDRFVFAAGVSPSIDVPSRPFSIKRISRWRHYSSIFGPWGSQTRRNGNPLILARNAEPGKHRNCFSRAAIKKDCFRQIAILRPCSASATSASNFTWLQVDMTGINGTRGCPVCFKVCSRI